MIWVNIKLIKFKEIILSCLTLAAIVNVLIVEIRLCLCTGRECFYTWIIADFLGILTYNRPQATVRALINTAVDGEVKVAAAQLKIHRK